MNCPICGCVLKEGRTAKGASFLTCSQWPKCRVSGTPELLAAIQYASQALRDALADPWAKLDVLERLERFDAPPRQEFGLHQPVRVPPPIGSFIGQVAQIRIHQSRLRKAKTAEEREQIRNQAREVLR